MRSIVICAVLCLGLPSYGCAVHQTKHVEGNSFSVGEKAADRALTLLGKPYKYGGAGVEGFDCSGLVRYSYLAAGKDLPHSTSGLRQKTRPISLRNIRKGDLVFFTQLGKKYSHVGIYVGDNNFVHAPSSGKSVRMNSLEDRYWEEHFLCARRL